MPIGATVFRIRTGLIFIECWNLITPDCEQEAAVGARRPVPAGRNQQRGPACRKIGR